MGTQAHWYSTLSNEQYAAVSAPLDAPLLVIAGPGSGKTHFLVNRMIRDLREGTGAIVALTFTRKAAEEMERRVNRDPLTPKDKQLWVGTFHRLAITLIQAFPSKAGFAPKARVTIASKEHRKAATAKILVKYPNLITDLKLTKILPCGGDDGNSDSEEEQDGGNDPASLLARMLKNNTASVAQHPLLSTLRTQFAEMLRAKNMLLLADIIPIATKMVVDHPGVKLYVSKKAQSLYIDELQDTSDDQLAFLHSFCENRVTAVGDDDQSIYEWREGCSCGQVKKFGDRLKATYLMLNRNFRSTQAIVNVALSVIRHNPERVAKPLFSDIDDASKPILVVKKDAAAEARCIADIIGAATGGETSTSRDWAVLARLQHTLQHLTVALEKLGVPVVNICDAQIIWTKKELDVIAYTRMLVDPGNDPSFVRVYNIPKRGLSKSSTLFMLKDLCGAMATCLDSKDTIFDGMIGIFESWNGDSASPAAARDRSFWGATQRLLGKQLQQGPSIGLRAFVALLDGLRADLQKPCSARDAIGAILAATDLEGGRVMHAASSVVKPSGLDAIREFLRTLPSTKPDLQGDFVTLSTVHRAKGLEWDNVVVARCNEGTFPLANSDICEERRLFYVALTRARRKLYCTAHLDGGGPSGFFEEARGFSSFENSGVLDNSIQPIAMTSEDAPMPIATSTHHVSTPIALRDNQASIPKAMPSHQVVVPLAMPAEQTPTPTSMPNERGPMPISIPNELDLASAPIAIPNEQSPEALVVPEERCCTPISTPHGQAFVPIDAPTTLSMLHKRIPAPGSIAMPEEPTPAAASIATCASTTPVVMSREPMCGSISAELACTQSAKCSGFLKMSRDVSIRSQLVDLSQHPSSPSSQQPRGKPRVHRKDRSMAAHGTAPPLICPPMNVCPAQPAFSREKSNWRDIPLSQKRPRSQDNTTFIESRLTNPCPSGPSTGAIPSIESGSKRPCPSAPRTAAILTIESPTEESMHLRGQSVKCSPLRAQTSVAGIDRVESPRNSRIHAVDTPVRVISLDSPPSMQGYYIID